MSDASNRLEGPAGVQPSDSPALRLISQVLGGAAAPLWITLWLVLILVALVVLAAVAGPWVPGGLTAVAGLAASGKAIARRRRL